MLFADLTYWPRQYVIGFVRLWQFNGLAIATRLTACNFFGVRQLFRVELHGFEISLRSGTPDLAVAIDSLGREFAPVIGLPDPGGLIIDAGGYIGTAAIRLAQAFPASRIISIEPSTDNLAMLHLNVAPYPNIAVIEAALGATEGTAVLRDAGTGEWGFSTIADSDGTRPALGAVPTVTIDAILAHEGRDGLFLLKLDVEGAEVEILGASKGWVNRTEIIIAELHEKLAPGAEAAFGSATAGRSNRRLPGEKVMSTKARTAS